MKLLNFKLGTPPAIEIEADGFVWDMHNACSFLILSQDMRAEQVVLTWKVEPQWRRLNYRVDFFTLTFQGVDYFEITPRDLELPISEDECLDTVGFVNVTHDAKYFIEMGVPYPPPDHDMPFHMFFIFQGGQRVRIGCYEAEFKA